MKASEKKLLDFLKKSEQFMIPIYQRTYSWTRRECQQLWDDILHTGRKENIHAHFMGAIVYIEKGLYSHHISSKTQLMIIDGQQRLTTVMLIIEALARQVGKDEPQDGFSARKLRNRYLCDPDEEGEAAHKLLLTETDKDTLLAILGQKRLPDKLSLHIQESFKFFEKQVREQSKYLQPLCMGLTKLMIVDIALSRDLDNPQLIFESMNSTGRGLSQADLIRNFILMGLESERQSELYNDYWRPMETTFGQEAYTSHFDKFVRYWLTVKTGSLPNIGKVYEEFKQYTRDNDKKYLIADLRKFAGHYCKMELGKETHPGLRAAFADLRELKANVVYPFLLEIYNDYVDGLLPVDELGQIVRLVESYVFRRAVCEMPTNSLNKTFPFLIKMLDKDHYLESVQAQLLLLQSYRRFPDDSEFRRELRHRDLYSFTRRSYWLRRLENHQRKEQMPVDKYTIEHIMPQNENLSPAWKESLGNDWQRVHKDYLHTLGNLTLTGYNSEYSDRPFVEKRDMQGGFQESPLRLNEGLRDLENWNEKTIQARAERLADKAVNVWAAPSLPAETLKNYQPRTSEKRDAYTIDDHKFLADGRPMRRLFERFRKEVQNLDPCVTEEFRKRYVSYKAETNFVDVVAQDQQLKIWLNLQFHEINDPRGRTRDVTNIGHLGIGNVEMVISKPEEIPYVAGLVRQAFDKQMGD